MNKPPCIIVDIDGTIAERGDRGPFDWKKVIGDQPKKVIINLVSILHPIYDIILLSGRSDECRDLTEKWLEYHDVAYTTLHMRKADDMRKDAIVKQEIYEHEVKPHYDVEFVLDDRNQVVEMWRSLGLTCLQVAPGDF